MLGGRAFGQRPDAAARPADRGFGALAGHVRLGRRSRACLGLRSLAIARLQQEQRNGSGGRSARAIAEELDVEERLGEELRRFRAEVERIAGLGWKPDLDDGLLLCAAPLADLFPTWPDATKARDELRNGKHGWTTVARWADAL